MVDNSSHLQYSRITLTRSTTCYFFLVLASCIVQVILQASTFSVNTQGVQMLSTILAEAKISQGFPIIQGSALQICDSIPGQDGTVCYIVSGQNSTSSPKTAGGQDQVTSSVVGSFILSTAFSAYILHRKEDGLSRGKRNLILLVICRVSSSLMAHLHRRPSATNVWFRSLG